MKKIIIFLFLSFILTSKAFSSNYLNVVFKEGISKKEMCELTRNKKMLRGTGLPGAAYCHKAFQSKYIFLPKYNTEIIPPLET